MHGTPQWVCRANKKWNWTRRSIVSLDFWVTTPPREGRKFLKTTTFQINLPREFCSNLHSDFTNHMVVHRGEADSDVTKIEKVDLQWLLHFIFCKTSGEKIVTTDLDPPRRENAVAGLRMFLRPILARQINYLWNYSWRLDPAVCILRINV